MAEGEKIFASGEQSENDAATNFGAPTEVTSGQPPASPEAVAAAQEEAKLIRRLQMMMNMVMGVIAQDNTLSYDEAANMVADARTAALAMFPGKELAYDLIWRPRFQRLMRERFRLV